MYHYQTIPDGFVDHTLSNKWRDGNTSFTPLWDIAR